MRRKEKRTERGNETRAAQSCFKGRSPCSSPPPATHLAKPGLADHLAKESSLAYRHAVLHLKVLLLETNLLETLLLNKLCLLALLLLVQSNLLT